VESQSLQQKEKQREKIKGKENFKSQNFESCACLSQNVFKRDSSGKNG